MLKWLSNVVYGLGISAYVLWGASAVSGSVNKDVSSELRFEHISVSQGLSNSTVMSILQDRDGFLWFGTEDGLNRFDGHNFKIYHHVPGDSNGLLSSNINRLYQDRAGFLWVGTWQGLDKFDPHRETFVHYHTSAERPHRLTGGRVMTITEDADGLIWVGTAKGLNIINPKTGEVISDMTGDNQSLNLSHEFVRCILVDHQETVWVGTNHGLNRWNPAEKAFTQFFNSGELGNVIVDMCSRDKGTFWIGTPAGLFTFDTSSGRFSPYPEPSVQDRGLNCDHIFDMFKDTNGILWIATRDGGLNRLNPATGTFSHIRSRPEHYGGLSVDFVRSIFEDRSGLLWFGTQGGGLNKLDPRKNKFKHYQKDASNSNSLSQNIVMSILEDSNGFLWLGTAGGGLNRYDPQNQQYTHYRKQSSKQGKSGGLSNDFIRALWEDSKHRIWIATGAGLDCLNPVTGKIIHYQEPVDPQKNMNVNFITSLCPSVSGELWFGSFGGLGKINIHTGDMNRFVPQPGDSSGSTAINHLWIKKLYEDSSGVLWIATSGGGLNRRDPGDGRFKHYMFDPENANSPGSNNLEAIIESHDGYLWIGSGGGGFCRFDRNKETFVRYNTKNGLPANTVYGILEDDKGNLWLSTSNGLSVFNPETEHFWNYNIHDGLLSNEFNSGAFFKSKRELMYFGCIEGFTVFKPEEIIASRNKTVPPVLITSFKKWNKEVKLPRAIEDIQSLTLSYQDKMISFEFTALDFSAPAKNRYAYKMEGLSNDWVYVDSGKRFASFTNLQPSQYTFKVKASNNDGVWNEKGVSIRIVVTPPFWKTWWFKLLSILALIGLAYFWHRRRMNSLYLRLKSEAEMERFFEKYQVTKREKEIIELILKGKTNKDIEEQLYISLNTVKSYIYRIYKKFGVQNRLELIHLIQKSQVNK